MADLNGSRRLLGVGVDLADPARLRAALARRPGMAERIFTPAESTRLGDDPLAPASAFALKEAVMKSLGVGLAEVALTEVERGEDGAVVLHGRAARRAEVLGVGELEVRTEPLDDLCLAVALAWAA